MGEMAEFKMDVESVFGVTFTDSEAESCGTPRQLADIICAKLGVCPPSVCQSQRAFYLLRRRIGEQFGVPRNSVRPSAPLASILSGANPCRNWYRLRNSLHAALWPALDAGGCFFRFFVAGMIAWFSLWAAYFVQRATLWGKSPHDAIGGLAIIVLIVGAFLAVVFALYGKLRVSPYRLSLTASVRDLVPYVLTSSDVGWTRDTVASTLKLIITTMLGVSDSFYNEDLRFVDDLKMD